LVNWDSLLSEQYQHFRDTASPMACIILCLRFTLVVRLFVGGKNISSNRKVFTIHNLRATSKTRYGRLARPCPTGTFTLLVATSFACRTNANIQRRPFCSAAEKRASGGGPSGPERTGMTG